MAKLQIATDYVTDTTILNSAAHKQAIKLL